MAIAALDKTMGFAKGSTHPMNYDTHQTMNYDTHQNKKGTKIQELC
jgi:hypothetical protein